MTASASGYTVQLEKLQQFYALTIGPFSTEAAAHAFFPKLRAGLLWASLKDTIGISYPKKLSDTRSLERAQPIEAGSHIASITETVGWTTIDGDYDADKAVVRSDAKKLLRYEMGAVRIIAGIAADHFVKRVAEALAFPAAEKIVHDAKLLLAIDLYSSFSFEVSNRARFIALVTVLEALTPEGEISAAAKEELEAAKKLLIGRRDAHKVGSEKRAELERLVGRLGNLKSEAIGAMLHSYLASVVRECPALGESAEVVKKVRDIYRYRSELLHSGSTNEEALEESLAYLQSFVPRLLEELYKQKSGADS